jgi:hypothetical protein
MNPVSQNVFTGQNVAYTVSTAVTSGSAQPVDQGGSNPEPVPGLRLPTQPFGSERQWSL